jgi:glutaredoxin-related protein
VELEIPKKTSTKKSSPKKTSTKKSSPKKTSTKKSSPKKTSTKKSSPKKTSSKKSYPKKTSSKKSSPKKSSPKKSSPKKSSSRKISLQSKCADCDEHGCPVTDIDEPSEPPQKQKLKNFTDLLEQEGDPNQAILFVGKHGCPHCTEAMTLLQSLSYLNKNKIKYVDILEPRNRHVYEQFKTNSWTVPQIFIGNIHLEGGNTKLRELYAGDKLEDIVKRTNAYITGLEESDPADQIPKMLGNPESNILVVVQGDVMKSRSNMCHFCVETIDLLLSLPYLDLDKVGIVDIDQEDPLLRMYLYKHNLGIPLIYINNKYYEKGLLGLRDLKNCDELESFVREIGAHD